ncbi:hypothetical protein T439DRAFT_224767 [Meredithblackwellia eburnea MCA 4105]
MSVTPQKRPSPSTSGASATASSSSSVHQLTTPSSQQLQRQVRKRPPGRVAPYRLQAFLDSVQDDYDFEPVLLAFENTFVKQFHPHHKHIRFILSLAVSPKSSLPNPNQNKKRSAKATGAPSGTRPTALPPPSLDPLVPNEAKIRRAANKLLLDLAGTCGPHSVGLALPGSTLDEQGLDWESLLQDIWEKDEEERRMNSFGNAGGLAAAPLAPSSLSHGGLPTPPSEPRYDSNQETMTTTSRSHGSATDEFKVDDDDTEATRSAKRVGSACEHVWDLVGGKGRASWVVDSMDEVQPFRISKITPVLSPGGWEFLETCVQVWELEAKEWGRLTKGREFAPSFLRQFKPKDMGARDISSRALDVIFWPFTNFTSSPSSRASSEEPLPATLPEFGEDEMELADKRALSGRLIGLIGQLTLAGKLDSSNVMREIGSRVDRKDTDNVANFLEYCRTTTPKAFLIKFCSYLLELQSNSHPSRQPGLPPPGTTTSPVRRPMSHSQSQSQGSQSQSPYSQSQGEFYSRNAPIMPFGSPVRANGSSGGAGSPIFAGSPLRATNSALANAGGGGGQFSLPSNERVLFLLTKMPKELDISVLGPSASNMNAARRPSGVDPKTFWRETTSRFCATHLVIKRTLLELMWECASEVEDFETVKRLESEGEKVLSELVEKVELVRTVVAGP